MFIINTCYAFMYLVFILIRDNGLLLFIIYDFNDIELLDDAFSKFLLSLSLLIKIYQVSNF